MRTARRNLKILPRHDAVIGGLPLLDIEQIQDATNKFPEISAIYFLFKRSKLVYVGQSLNMFERLTTHRKKQVIDWDRYAFFGCHPEDLYSYERQYIKKLNPTFNKRCRIR